MRCYNSTDQPLITERPQEYAIVLRSIEPEAQSIMGSNFTLTVHDCNVVGLGFGSYSDTRPSIVRVSIAYQVDRDSR